MARCLGLLATYYEAPILHPVSRTLLRLRHSRIWQNTRILLFSQATILMALLQPAPEVYNLFDDIMLLAEGHIVYYGPKEEVCLRNISAAVLAVLQPLTENIKCSAILGCPCGSAHVPGGRVASNRSPPRR